MCFHAYFTLWVQVSTEELGKMIMVQPAAFTNSFRLPFKLTASLIFPGLIIVDVNLMMAVKSAFDRGCSGLFSSSYSANDLRKD